MRKSSFLPMAVITIAAAVFALAAADAQSRKKFGRTSASKKELDTRYQKLQEELPSLQSAAVSEDEKMREEAKRRAFSVVDKALNKELDEEVAKEKARTSAADSVDSASESIRSSERSLEGAQEILPKADARRFAAMPDDAQLVSAFSGQDPADSTSGKDDGGTDFDGLKAVTADGETFTVPGIDVAEKFDGSAVPVQGNGPAPGPKPQPFVDKKKAKNAPEVTEITCTGEAVFSSTGTEEALPEGQEPGPPIVIFKENVHVKHPEFTIDCDRLIAYMKKSDDKGGNAGADQGGIERVIATGREVTVRKKIAGGKVKIGKARRLTFDAATGDVVLEDWPQVQDGENIQMAAKQSTVMVIKKDGRMVANGPTRAVIVPKTGGDSAVPGEN